MFLSIGAAAILLGVSISTLRRWEKEGSLLANHRTRSGHRRYSKSQIKEYFGELSETDQAVKAVCYARVSSHDQKKDLETQKEKLEDFAKKRFADFEVISDLGSGLSAPSEAWHFQEVKFLPRQAMEPWHLESSLEPIWATRWVKRRQSECGP